MVQDAVDARKDAEERARRAEDLSVNARTRFKEWDGAKAALEDELAAVRKEAAAEKEKASARQLQLHERVMQLTDQLSEARARSATSTRWPRRRRRTAKMEEAARAPSRGISRRRRVRFAANMVAAGARDEVTTAVGDDDQGATTSLAEVANAGGVVGSRRADALAEMAAQMASMREELAAIRRSRPGMRRHPRRPPEGTPEGTPGAARVHALRPRGVGQGKLASVPVRQPRRRSARRGGDGVRRRSTSPT